MAPSAPPVSSRRPPAKNASEEIQDILFTTGGFLASNFPNLMPPCRVPLFGGLVPHFWETLAVNIVRVTPVKGCLLVEHLSTQLQGRRGEEEVYTKCSV